MPFLQGKSSSPSLPAAESPRKGAFGFSAKFQGPFWKSKSKNSVGSESQGSTVSGLGSPPFTPDSSLSIYTNSLDSDCSNSSTTSSSNQVSPSQNSLLFTSSGTRKGGSGGSGGGQGNNKMKKPGRSGLEDQISTYSYNNDCERYAANMFYDMGDACSFECRVPVTNQRSRSRNTSIPVTPPFEEDDCVHSYYNNSTFTTFPNPRRRHSIAYSSYSSSLTSNGSSTKRGEEMIELLPLPNPGLPGPDGYLVPISNGVDSRSKTGCKNRESNNNNVYQNDSVTSAIVEVDVHVSDPSSSASSSGATVVVNSGTGSRSSSVTRLLLNRSQQASSNDSDSTVTIVPLTDQQDGGASGKDRLLYMSRILLATSDCEPFCSLCATSAVTASTKTSSMDVAIIYYHQCYFSRVINDKISLFFERMVTPDNQKINIALQVYDLKDLDQQSVAAEVHRAKVQIIIISNPFLDWLRHEAASRKKLSPVNRVLRSKRVIAILTGTTAADVSAGHQAVLARFNEWFTLELSSASKMDGEFCKHFTDQVVKIYNVEQGTSGGGGFSVFPKKVTREQPKIVIMLKKPLEAQDTIHVEVAKGREVETLKNVTPTNPYTVIIRIPDGLAGEKTALFEITMYVNQLKLGTKLVKYEHQPRLAEEDVILKMVKALPGFQKLLDEHISKKLTQHFRESTDWSLDPELELMNDALVSRVENLPTVMHFSAYYGLEQTLWTVLDEAADGLEQCETRNEFNETPLDIAQGNTEQILKDYQELSVSCKTFDLMKRLIDENEDSEDALANGVHGDGDEVSSVLDEDSREENTTVTEDTSERTSGNMNGQNAISDYDVPPAVPSGAGGVTAVGAATFESSLDDAPKLQVPPTPRRRKPTHAIRDPIDMNYINISNNREASAVENKTSGVPSNDQVPPTPPKFRPPIREDDPLLNYDVPNPAAPVVSDNYQCPPPARPVSPFHFEAGRKPERKYSGEYIPMDTPMSKSNGQESPKVPTQPVQTSYVDMRHDEERTVIDKNGKRVPAIVLDYAEKELYDIMQDYKKNLLSMRQLEILFEHWKKRPHVKSSYAERSEKLKEMREEYRRIQDQMKKHRRPSVLEKVTHLFARKKGSTADHATENSSRYRTSPTDLFPSNPQDGFVNGTPGEAVLRSDSFCSLRSVETASLNNSISNLPVLERDRPLGTWKEERHLVSGSYVAPSPGGSSVFPVSSNSGSPVTSLTSPSPLQNYYNEPNSKRYRRPPPPIPSEPSTPMDTPAVSLLSLTTVHHNVSKKSPSPPPRPAKKPPPIQIDYENEVASAGGSLSKAKPKLPPYANTPA